MSDYEFSGIDWSSLRFPECGASARSAADALRALIDSMTVFNSPFAMSMKVAVAPEDEKARLSDDEWNNIMKNIGGK